MGRYDARLLLRARRGGIMIFGGLEEALERVQKTAEICRRLLLRIASRSDQKWATLGEASHLICKQILRTERAASIGGCEIPR